LVNMTHKEYDQAEESIKRSKAIVDETAEVIPHQCFIFFCSDGVVF
jgi:hypothetical protein